jgi:hypothetical protein
MIDCEEMKQKRGIEREMRDEEILLNWWEKRSKSHWHIVGGGQREGTKYVVRRSNTMSREMGMRAAVSTLFRWPNTHTEISRKTDE